MDQIDITKLGPLRPGRIQDESTDAAGDPKIIPDELLAHGTEVIPFLIGKLDDETRIQKRIIPYWYKQTVGDIALVLLHDFFAGENERQSSVPGFLWDDFLERGDDRDLTGEDVLRRYIRKHGRSSIKLRWQRMWDENKDEIFLDDQCKCFKIRS